MYYVYAHVAPDNGELLYIGKGTDARAWTKKGRKCGHVEVLEALDREYGRGSYVRIIADDLDESDAFLLEKGLIWMNQPSMNEHRFELKDDEILDYRDLYVTIDWLWRPPVI